MEERRLFVADWSAARTPPAPLFRIGEALCEVVASEDLGEALRVASGGLLGQREVRETELSQRAVHTFHPLGHRARAVDAAAEGAFWALVSGDSGARKQACASAEWAWWVARCVDGTLKPDTAQAIAKDSLASALAAMHFGDARAALRKACASDWLAARLFSRFVSGEVAREFEAALREAGEDLERERETARALHEALAPKKREGRGDALSRAVDRRSLRARASTRA